MSSVTARDLVLDPHPDPHAMNMAGYEHYLGHPVVSGMYRIGGEGELYIALDRQASQSFPHADGQAIDIYIGDTAAVTLGISQAVKAIDMTHICGLNGHATVELSGVWTGIVEDRCEYSSDLVRVITRTPAHLEDCSGVVP
ncbi:hypothetical protein B0E51_17800 [Rhodanobacter sp. C05]|nr:hypothetical protein B0E51_17800 [Rhodanobacter sp. C05]